MRMRCCTFDRCCAASAAVRARSRSPIRRRIARRRARVEDLRSSSSISTCATAWSTTARSRASAAKLDGYVTSLADRVDRQLPRDEQIAFWLNAYNALVLQTVIDHYPIPAHVGDYPAQSIRQIPGAFERLPHRVGRPDADARSDRADVLPAFHDPRVYLRARPRRDRQRPAAQRGLHGGAARGAADGGRGRVRHARAVRRRSTARTTRSRVSSIFSWREKDFVAAYADKAPAAFATRSPIERAVARVHRAASC